MAISVYKQLTDYVDSLRAYLSLGSGIAANRIIYAKPDVALRKLRQREEKLNPAAKTKEIDQYLSFFFPTAGHAYADDRVGVAQAIRGGLGQSSRQLGYVINTDITIQVDIWGGPKQDSKAFVFDAQLKLVNHLYRNQRLFVDFTELVTKDLNDPTKTFDVNGWYELKTVSVADTSDLENLFVKGETHRATLELLLYASFYIIPTGPPVTDFHKIIIEYENAQGETEENIEVTSTTTSSTTSTSSTSTSTSTTLSSSSTTTP